MKFSWSKCADILMMSRTTLWRRAVELGISHEPSEKNWTMLFKELLQVVQIMVV